MNAKRLIALAPLVVLIALLAVFGYYNFHKKAKYEPRTMVGKALPALSLASLDDAGPQNIKAIVAGYDHPVLINLFASWCVPCAAENAQLMELKARGVVIIGVAWKDEPKNTQNFLNLNRDPYALVLSDPDGALALDLGITGVPETFVVAPDGTITDKIAGPILPETMDMIYSRLKGGSGS
jgi:cytochrome c biogenesis protein CcmG/thiol:disulfide interchange protein DsbE